MLVSAATTATLIVACTLATQTLADLDTSARIAALACTAAVFGVGMLLGLRRTAGVAPAPAEATDQDTASTFEHTLGHLPVPLALVRPHGEIAASTTALTSLLGRRLRHLDELAELVLPHQADEIRRILEPLGREDITLSLVERNLEADGAARAYTVSARDLRTDPAVRGHVLLFKSEDEATLRAHATNAGQRDQLTGLPDRQGLESELWSRGGRALLLIDIDDLTPVTDAHGHAVGNELLRAVAGRLVSLVSQHDRLFRTGTGEFAVLVHDPEGRPHDVATAAFSLFADPFLLSVGPVDISASVGLAIHREPDAALAMLERAGAARDDARTQGGNRLVTTELDDGGRSDRRSAIGRAFLQAAIADEFHLEFQPIVDARLGRISHFEALARWVSPVVGPVRPDEFIPIAESSGRIDELGDWVLDEALSTLAIWRRQGVAAGIGITVNASPYQLEDLQFVSRTRAALVRHGIEPAALTIELTESALVTPRNPIVGQLEALRQLGCGIACDDFGSGYSNLGQLMTLPLDTIKLDRSLLVRLVEQRSPSEAEDAPFEMMTACARMASSMQATLIAEGIETAAQARAVTASGVTLLQGYHFSRPLPGHEVAAYMQRASSPEPLSRR